ncbi:hypothetical protein BDC45DRAFT_537711 [Circinella umbellata]|nr:hypothetical protein BDC45DRAFT_537711 [Circinella umbellata]
MSPRIAASIGHILKNRSYSNITFYSEDGRGNIFDDKGNEATACDESPSFRLKKITDLKKLVKNNTYSELHEIEVPDVRMKKASFRNERDTEYNVYTEKDILL